MPTYADMAARFRALDRREYQQLTAAEQAEKHTLITDLRAFEDAMFSATKVPAGAATRGTLTCEPRFCARIVNPSEG